MPVLLFEPDRTPYDIRWRMFGIDCRVHPMFWLVSVIMGWSAMNRPNGFALLLIWVFCVFLSILIHELGHVVAGRVFGTHGHIVLYGFGGLAIGSSALPSRWQRIFVFLAGPLAGFLFLGGIFVILRLADPARAAFFVADVCQLVGFKVKVPLEYLDAIVEGLIDDALWDLIVINLFWGLINLLPVYPLDGGQVSRELFNLVMNEKGVRASLGVSLVVAGLMAVNSLAASNGKPLIPYLPPGGLYTAFLFGMLAIGNFQEMQQSRPTPQNPWGDEGRPWERDPDYWKRH
jgi:Zn-dependent protease